MNTDINENYWRGTVDATLRTLTQDLSATRRELAVGSAAVQAVSDKVQRLEVRVENLSTKLVIYASLGATLGSALVSVIVGIAFRTLGH